MSQRSEQRQLGDAGVTNTINGLKDLGASADTIVENVRERFADNPQVTRITGPAQWTTTTTTTTAPTIDLDLLLNRAFWMANELLHTVAQQARTEALVEQLLEEEYQRELLSQLGHGTLRTPPPPISQTLGNPRPIEIPLLPAGQHLQNTVDTAIELTIPAILHANADDTDAQNAAVVAAAGAMAEAAADAAGSDGEDPCNDEEDIYDRYADYDDYGDDPTEVKMMRGNNRASNARARYEERRAGVTDPARREAVHREIGERKIGGNENIGRDELREVIEDVGGEC